MVTAIRKPQPLLDYYNGTSTSFPPANADGRMKNIPYLVPVQYQFVCVSAELQEITLPVFIGDEENYPEDPNAENNFDVVYTEIPNVKLLPVNEDHEASFGGTTIKIRNGFDWLRALEMQHENMYSSTSPEANRNRDCSFSSPAGAKNKEANCVLTSEKNRQQAYCPDTDKMNYNYMIRQGVRGTLPSTQNLIVLPDNCYDANLVRIRKEKRDNEGNLQTWAEMSRTELVEDRIGGSYPQFELQKPVTFPFFPWYRPDGNSNFGMNFPEKIAKSQWARVDEGYVKKVAELKARREQEAKDKERKEAESKSAELREKENADENNSASCDNSEVDVESSQSSPCPSDDDIDLDATVTPVLEEANFPRMQKYLVPAWVYCAGASYGKSHVLPREELCLLQPDVWMLYEPVITNTSLDENHQQEDILTDLRRNCREIGHTCTYLEMQKQHAEKNRLKLQTLQTRFTDDQQKDKKALNRVHGDYNTDVMRRNAVLKSFEKHQAMKIKNSSSAAAPGPALVNNKRANKSKARGTTSMVGTKQPRAMEGEHNKMIPDPHRVLLAQQSNFKPPARPAVKARPAAFPGAKVAAELDEEVKIEEQVALFPGRVFAAAASAARKTIAGLFGNNTDEEGKHAADAPSSESEEQSDNFFSSKSGPNFEGQHENDPEDTSDEDWTTRNNKAKMMNKAKAKARGNKSTARGNKSTARGVNHNARGKSKSRARGGAKEKAKAKAARKSNNGKQAARRSRASSAEEVESEQQDVDPVVQQDGAGGLLDPPMKKKGRPLGSKNKKTLAAEAELQLKAAADEFEENAKNDSSAAAPPAAAGTAGASSSSAGAGAASSASSAAAAPISAAKPPPKPRGRPKKNPLKIREEQDETADEGVEQDGTKRRKQDGEDDGLIKNASKTSSSATTSAGADQEYSAVSSSSKEPTVSNIQEQQLQGNYIEQASAKGHVGSSEKLSPRQQLRGPLTVPATSGALYARVDLDQVREPFADRSSTERVGKFDFPFCRPHNSFVQNGAGLNSIDRDHIWKKQLYMRQNEETQTKAKIARKRVEEAERCTRTQTSLVDYAVEDANMLLQADAMADLYLELQLQNVWAVQTNEELAPNARKTSREKIKREITAALRSEDPIETLNSVVEAPDELRSAKMLHTAATDQVALAADQEHDHPPQRRPLARLLNRLIDLFSAKENLGPEEVESWKEKALRNNDEKAIGKVADFLLQSEVWRDPVFRLEVCFSLLRAESYVIQLQQEKMNQQAGGYFSPESYTTASGSGRNNTSPLYNTPPSGAKSVDFNKYDATIASHEQYFLNTCIWKILQLILCERHFQQDLLQEQDVDTSADPTPTAGPASPKLADMYVFLRDKQALVMDKGDLWVQIERKEVDFNKTVATSTSSSATRTTSTSSSGETLNQVVSLKVEKRNAWNDLRKCFSKEPKKNIFQHDYVDSWESEDDRRKLSIAAPKLDRWAKMEAKTQDFSVKTLLCTGEILPLQATRWKTDTVCEAWEETIERGDRAAAALAFLENNEDSPAESEMRSNTTGKGSTPRKALFDFYKTKIPSMKMDMQKGAAAKELMVKQAEHGPNVAWCRLSASTLAGFAWQPCAQTYFTEIREQKQQLSSDKKSEQLQVQLKTGNKNTSTNNCGSGTSSSSSSSSSASCSMSKSKAKRRKSEVVLPPVDGREIHRLCEYRPAFVHEVLEQDKFARQLQRREDVDLGLQQLAIQTPPETVVDQARMNYAPDVFPPGVHATPDLSPADAFVCVALGQFGHSFGAEDRENLRLDHVSCREWLLLAEGLRGARQQKICSVKNAKQLGFLQFLSEQRKQLIWEDSSSLRVQQQLVADMNFKKLRPAAVQLEMQQQQTNQHDIYNNLLNWIEDNMLDPLRTCPQLRELDRSLQLPDQQSRKAWNRVKKALEKGGSRDKAANDVQEHDLSAEDDACGSSSPYRFMSRSREVFSDEDEDVGSTSSNDDGNNSMEFNDDLNLESDMMEGNSSNSMRRNSNTNSNEASFCSTPVARTPSAEDLQKSAVPSATSGAGGTSTTSKNKPARKSAKSSQKVRFLLPTMTWRIFRTSGRQETTRKCCSPRRPGQLLRG
ncbi:unnamed protein product [Amoebophrya sp. A120]|nr:unnamed protein product [Amoebophrya sp. A120]|eukprot:GSA120T00024218001.1